MFTYLLACSAGVFAFGRHLGFSNCGGLGRGPREQPRKQALSGKMARWEGRGRKLILYFTPTPGGLVQRRGRGGGIEPTYLAFRSEITPALQATYQLACEQAPSKGGKKIGDRKRDSVSKARGSRSVHSLVTRPLSARPAHRRLQLTIRPAAPQGLRVNSLLTRGPSQLVRQKKQ